MENEEWRVEAYRGMEVYVLVSEQHGKTRSEHEDSRWGFEVRVGQEGGDPSDAGENEILSSGDRLHPSRKAAETAAFDAAYRLVDKLVGPPG